MMFYLRILRVAIVCSIAVGVATVSLGAKKEKGGYLSPPDLMKVAEKSEQTYKIASLDELEDLILDQFPETYWPTSGNELDFPQILEDENGELSLVVYDIGEECHDLLLEAEPFFKDESYDKAMKFYKQAIEKAPQCYVAYSHLGDCHHFQDREEEALRWYDKAAGMNPHDFRMHFYRGNALYELGRYEEARDAYVRALTLRPHRESVVKVLKARADELGIDVVDQPFLPRALARQEEDGIGVYIDLEGPWWMVYGLCKAIWIGEPAHREERTDGTDHVWSLVEERQCLMSMLESYYAMQENDPAVSDPEMERILGVIKDGMLDGFVLYEIAYRLHPHAVLLFPEQVHDEVVEYVNHHVIIRKQGDASQEGGEEK